MLLYNSCLRETFLYLFQNLRGWDEYRCHHRVQRAKNTLPHLYNINIHNSATSILPTTRSGRDRKTDTSIRAKDSNYFDLLVHNWLVTTLNCRDKTTRNHNGRISINRNGNCLIQTSRWSIQINKINSINIVTENRIEFP